MVGIVRCLAKQKLGRRVAPDAGLKRLPRQPAYDVLEIAVKPIECGDRPPEIRSAPSSGGPCLVHAPASAADALQDIALPMRHMVDLLPHRVHTVARRPGGLLHRQLPQRRAQPLVPPVPRSEGVVPKSENIMPNHLGRSLARATCLRCSTLTHLAPPIYVPC